MANSIGAFVSIEGIETEGAASLSGVAVNPSLVTRISSSTGFTPIEATTLGEIYTVYLAVVDDDGYYPNLESLNNMYVEPPYGMEVSVSPTGPFTSDATDLGFHADGVYRPFYIRALEKYEDTTNMQIVYGEYSNGAFVPFKLPFRSSLIFRDGFNRADAANVGQYWTEATASTYPIDAHVESGTLHLTHSSPTNANRRIHINSTAIPTALTDYTSEVTMTTSMNPVLKFYLAGRCSSVYNDTTLTGLNYYEMYISRGSVSPTETLYFRLRMDGSVHAPDNAVVAGADRIASDITEVTGGAWCVWSPTVGDKFRLVMEGTSIQAWAKHTTGNWEHLMTMVDSHISSGRFAIGIFGQAFSDPDYITIGLDDIILY